jgi:hypothetical protein
LTSAAGGDNLVGENGQNDMTPHDIRQIVESVVSDKQIVNCWYFVVMLIVAGLSGFFGAYLSTKGKHLATKEDIGRITNEIEKVKSTYAKQLERYKKELENRFKAEKVADLYARAFYKDPDLRDFNRLNWELSLYLPKDIVCEISQKLVKARTPDEAMKVLIMVREYFEIKDGLQWDNIAYSVPEKKEPEPTAGANSHSAST